MTLPRFLAPVLLLTMLAASSRGGVVLNEIMYHPASELPAEEWIELFNSDAAPVDLTGWKITSGVQFAFPNGATIPAGGFLVVAANAAAFQAAHPGVVNFVAGWTGQLSNSANHVALENAQALKVDEVSYADDGDWAVRQRDVALDFGHRGYGWDSGADGRGKSLELINAAFENDLGQNWRASVANGGTPGAANNAAAGDIAPVILDVQHFPLVPKSTDSVSVSAQVVDDAAGSVSVTLLFRNDGAASFSSTPMLDDGTHGDAAPGDGVFGAILPAQASGTIVEFYVQASDATAHTRTWPAPSLDENGAASQSVNCLYQVDDTTYAGASPIYRVILRAADRAELTQINTNTPSINGVDQTYSHAKFNATWITMDGTSTELRYLTGVRNRGNGSRELQPQSFNVSFLNELPWKGHTSLNLNSQNTPYQLFGSAIYRQAGLASPESRQVQLRVNDVNPASGSGAPAYGFYVANEVQNNEFADHHFPLDSSGNIYRGQRIDANASPSGKTVLHGANLGYITPGAGEPLSQVELYGLNYFKQTNESENDWSDLIGLTAALAKGRSDASFNTTYDADYVSAVQARVDVDQWMRFLAVNTLADNSETNIAMGDGDDYYLYIGAIDPRAKLVPYDLDTIFGRSAGSNLATHSIFRMNTAPGSEGAGPTPLNAFTRNPEFAPIYYRELKRGLDGPFAPAQFDPIVDEILAPVVNASVISAIKAFNVARTAYVAAQIPLAISVTNSQTTAGVDLTPLNGYPRTTVNSVKLIGRANAITTRSVKVNGAAASWSAWNATWTAPSVALTPGVNRILIQSLDATGAEIERAYTGVWYDDGSQVTANGTISTTTTWTAAGGPYRVDGSLTIASGATLTIQPGTTVWLGTAASTVNVTIASGGRLLAEGTEAQPIRFMVPPGGTYSWGGIAINGAAGTPESRIAYAYFEGNSATAIEARGADVVLDHLQFGNTTKQYVALDGASFLVSNCIFPAPTALFEGVHGTLGIKAGGHGIVRDCFFGKANGYNDVFDFTGGNRPGPILQVINNVFMGSDDDILDLDGTDSWVEGNIFLHVHRNGAPDSSSAVSGGNDSGQTSEVTIIGNLFYDVDQAATAKQGNFYTMINNTIVDQNGRGSQDPFNAVINLADEGIPEGAGMYLEGNIIHSAEALARNYNPALSTVTLNNNLLPFAWTGPGSGNTVLDARLAHIPTIAETQFTTFAQAQVLRQWLALQPGSPAIGTGPNGRNKGGVVSLGASISGEPIGTTNQTGATLTVGVLRTGSGIPTSGFPNGSGFTSYKWKLDAGAFSAETPIATPITLSGLAPGSHTVSVIGKNDAGYYQNDALFGSSASVTVSRTWTVDPSFVPPPAQPLVQINEVLAKNVETQLFGTTAPDIIELRNAGTASATLDGWGLSENAALPFKYTFPAGTTLAPGATLVVYASSSANVPAPKTGFGLKDSGDTLTLTRSAAAGGGIADSIAFGAQLTDYSIGRRATDGAWDLCRPTFGSANIVAAQAPATGVKINEWLADARTLFAQDFIELLNPATLPVNIGGGYLSDNPVEWPMRHLIRPLTFIAPGGYVSFKADDDAGQGPDHVAFKLSPQQGEIGLFAATGALIDNVVYGPQSTDVSQGRTPNGASTLAFFNQPTPGAPNPGTTGGPATTTVNLLPAAQAWRYRSTSTDFSATFFATGFNDSAWTSGAQLLYIETAALTNSEGFAKTTALPVDSTNSSRPFNATYFRTHFTYSGPLSGVTLNAKFMCDDGCVIYLNGVEMKRVRMPAGAITFATIADTSIGDAVVETITLPADALVNGDNVLAVAVHQEHPAGVQSSSDVVWGMKLDATLPAAGAGAIVLNELLPINATRQNPDGSFAGWIELFNPSATATNIADLSLTDDLSAPRKWIAPAGTSIPAGGYLVVQCDPLAPASALNTGFALNGTGGGVFLFRKLAEGGGLLDSVAFGTQVPDFSLGRIANGSGAFTLTVPTRGALNSAAGLGPISAVSINEWFANSGAEPGWFELFNSGAQPVLLSGNFLSDNLADRTKYLLPPLTYLGGSGASRWRQLIADNDSSATPGHVNFTLNSSGESIGLFSANGVQLSAVTFGAQTAGISQGRFPDGTANIISMPPTPAAMNQQPAGNDSDLDGLPDDWEIANFGNLSQTAAGDADGDGQSNRAEFLAGTNPLSAASNFSARISATVPGQMHIQFTAQAGKGYTVQWKNTLNDATWQKLADVPAEAAAHAVDLTDSVGGNPQRFYRVVTPIQP